MTITNLGRIWFELTRDENGFRDYTIQWLIEDTTGLVGPQQVYENALVPITGSYWAYGVGDSDPYALCLPKVKMTPFTNKQEPSQFWVLENYFSTKPISRCQDDAPTTPLDEPWKISGSFVTRSREQTKNKDDQIFKYTSHELIRGQPVEFDENVATVSIEKNVADLDLAFFTGLQNHVNDTTMWGLGSRKVKFSTMSWSQMFYGTCGKYYNLRLEFDIDFRGFDRKTIDQGTKVLREGGSLTNPKDFVRYKDKRLENAWTLLGADGKELPADAPPHEIDLEYYQESNLFVLDIPTSF